MSSPPPPTAGPPLYRYVVISAAVVVGIILAAACLRMRLENRSRRLRRAGGNDILDDLVLREPLLFDAYLGPGTRAHQWDDMVPLSAKTLGPGSTPSITGKGEAVPAGTIRVGVSVVVRMPVPPSQPDLPPAQGEEEQEAPYVELGVVDVDVVQPAGVAKHEPL